MKSLNRLIIWPILLFINFLNAQIQFEHHIIKDYTHETKSTVSIHAADLDNDGDLDILVGSHGDHKISWYENLDGQGNFGVQQLISTTAHPFSIITGDIDGDGDLDVISYEGVPGSTYTMSWYKNLDGQGNFGSPSSIDEAVSATYSSIVSTDIDGDGDLDLVISIPSMSYGGIIWYENLDGLGGFSGRHLIEDVDTSQNIAAADFDGDGDIDIVATALVGYNVEWYENMDGLGNFSESYTIAIPSTLYSCEIVNTGDIDGDGDIDVLTKIPTSTSGHSDFVWLENTNGQGDFGEPQLIGSFDDPMNVSEKAQLISAVDMDNDGDLDVLAGRYWYENSNGEGDFNTSHPITSTNPATQSIAADINGNGYNDVISINVDSGSGTLVSVYIYNEEQDTFNNPIILTETPYGIRDIQLVDIDNDGDLDILSTSGFLSWQENIDGEGTFGPQKFIRSFHRLISKQNSYAKDMDNDEDIDILVGDAGGLYWIENIDGLGNFDTIHTIMNGVSSSIFTTGDIDNDGDFDIVYSYDVYLPTSKFVWFENIDGLGNFGSENILPNPGQVQSLNCIDIDNDGFIDISAGKYWLKNNDGLGGFNFLDTLLNNDDYYPRIFVDIDGDNDLDVISYEDFFSYPTEIQLSINIDGQGNYSAGQVIASGLNDLIFAEFADMDSDGDLDMVTGSALSYSNTSWHENVNGNGQFDSPQVVLPYHLEPTLDASYIVKPADIDNDGDMDVISFNSQSFNYGIIYLSENTGALSTEDYQAINFSVSPNPVSHILNIQSNINIIKVSIYNELGQLILERLNNFKINVAKLKSGIYFIKIEGENGSNEVKKIIIK